MRYPIAIEIGTDTAAYGVVVPDAGHGGDGRRTDR